MHYVIIFIIIAVIVVCQVVTFKSTLRKLETFRQTFPDNNKQFVLGQFEGGEPGIVINHKNEVLATIRDSINNYLHNNKGAVSDYHLIKDIVERNCDANEDEIDTQIPVPLYLGLVGTMAGILIGVGSLIFSGELNKLLGTAPNDFIKFVISFFKIEANGDGVESLLGGVAIAMFSSIVGIGLTTWGSSKARKYKLEVEKNKNTFLSWIQATLLPKLTDGTAAILDKVSQNLNQFNNTFSQNTHEMRDTFASVKDIYKDLSAVLNAINHLRINDLAKYNILVYEKMKNSAEEIGVLGEQLKGVNRYLSATNNVVEKLDLVFDREIQQFDQRMGEINKAVGKIDDGISKSLTQLTDNSQSQLETFIKSSSVINEKFGKATEDQQNTLKDAIVQQAKLFEEELATQESNFKNLLDNQNKTLAAKSKEVESLVVELHNLSEVKNGINNLEKSTKEQNQELSRLTHAIEKLAQLKVNEGGVINPWEATPRWVRISILSIGGIVGVAGLFIVIVEVLKLTDVLH